jgi:CRISPR-associated endonuclease Csn1
MTTFNGIEAKLRLWAVSYIAKNVVIERLKKGLSPAPENEKGNLPKFILSPNDLVYVPTKEEIENGHINQPIQKDRIYSLVELN